MKSFLFFAFVIFASASFSQSWSRVQLDSANTAKDISQLTDVEKETIMYLNLARLYPKEFAQNEAKDYAGAATMGASSNSSYQRSLISDLQKMKPIQRLVFDQSSYSLAKCFAKEAGDRGMVGHNRKKCPKPSGFYGECCSYGMKSGKDIVMQLLIDEGLKDLGHRTIILNPAFSKVGLSIAPHKKFATNTVIDFTN